MLVPPPSGSDKRNTNLLIRFVLLNAHLAATRKRQCVVKRLSCYGRSTRSYGSQIAQEEKIRILQLISNRAGVFEKVARLLLVLHVLLQDLRRRSGRATDSCRCRSCCGEAQSELFDGGCCGKRRGRWVQLFKGGRWLRAMRVVGVVIREVQVDVSRWVFRPILRADAVA